MIDGVDVIKITTNCQSIINLTEATISLETPQKNVLLSQSRSSDESAQSTKPSHLKLAIMHLPSPHENSADGQAKMAGGEVLVVAAVVVVVVDAVVVVLVVVDEVVARKH